MAYIQYNPNPMARSVGDCSVRAVAKALGEDWETAYIQLMVTGFEMCDMPSSNSVWGAVLRKNGFYRKAIPEDVPEDYTAEDFCDDHPAGTYVLAFGGHVATVKDGYLYDSWDSSQELPQFYWHRKEK